MRAAAMPVTQMYPCTRIYLAATAILMVVMANDGPSVAISILVLIIAIAIGVRFKRGAP